jgi:hypothetical protein
MVIFNMTGLLTLSVSFLRCGQLVQAISENERIHKVPALHAASGQKIEMSSVIPKVETLLGHHESAAA